MKNICLCLCLLSTTLLGQRGASIPFEKWISLKTVSNPVISPDGKMMVYSTNSTDWANNTYDSELWLVREGETPLPLTRTAKGSSTMAAFTPDGQYVSFLADRGDKTQLHIISVRGGEAIQVTRDEDGIGRYDWSPDGKRIVYTKPQPDGKTEKSTKERYGAFAVEGEEYRHNHLWLLNFHYDSVFLAGQLPCYGAKKDSSNTAHPPSRDCVKLPVARPLTEGNFSVSGFAWSPDGKYIAFNRQKDPLILSGISADIVLMDVDSGAMNTVVSHPTGDFFNTWAPDGKAFVYGSSISDSVSDYYKNNRLFIYDLNSKTSREIATDIDESVSVAGWASSGLYLGAFEKTKRFLYRVDLTSGASTRVNLGLDLPMAFSFAHRGDGVAIAGRSFSGLNELFWWRPGGPLAKA
ncbi:MAG TPA: hypothetical protein VK907_07680, partial [Phnomibacter sp.]|nr:hypothetical protein [Phnomibacter sp.]